MKLRSHRLVGSLLQKIGTSTIHDLPLEIQVHLFKYLDVRSLKEVRLVCSSWRTTVDILIGVPIVIDDTKRGNTLFAEQVVKTRILIKSLCKGTLGLLAESKSPHLTKSIAITGTVRDTLLSDLMIFSCLRKLVLEEKALSKDIFGQNISSTMHFPRLESLELRSLTDYYLIFCGFPSLEKLSSTVAKNLHNILSNTEAPRLKYLHIDGDVDQFDLPTAVNWKLKPLRRFLGVHHKTLEILYVSENNIIEVDGLSGYETVYDAEFPKQLKELQITLQGVNPSAYWCNLIKSQKYLRAIDIGLIDYPFCVELVHMLPSTLVTLSLFYNFDPVEILDLEVFAKMISLKKLQLMYDGMRGMEVVNFSALKNCTRLTTLEISQVLIKTSDLETLNTTLPNLETIYFLRIAYRKTRCDGFKLTLKALQNILSLRNLQFFHCEYKDMGDNINNVREMKMLINELIGTPIMTHFFVGEDTTYLSNNLFRRIMFGY